MKVMTALVKVAVPNYITERQQKHVFDGFETLSTIADFPLATNFKIVAIKDVDAVNLPFSWEEWVPKATEILQDQLEAEIGKWLDITKLEDL